MGRCARAQMEEVGLSFTGAQQGKFQPLVTEAWREHCKHPEVTGKTRCKGKRCGNCDFCAWYENELEFVTGKRSSKQLDVKRDFEKAMAHFAVGACNIYWIKRIHGADARRIIHEVQKVCADFEMDEVYMVGMAAQAVQKPVTSLDTLTYEELAKVLSAVNWKAQNQLMTSGEPF